MSITLYTAPDCLRCKIVKGFLTARQIPYETVDFKAEVQTFNAFYRAHRKAIYRNPEGVEFPLFHQGDVIKQGSGEIIAEVLSGKKLECAVTRSDLLHGWISGLYLSQCPADQEEAFLELVSTLASGGLSVCMQTDGSNPALLEKLIRQGTLAKLQLNIPGPASVYETLFGKAPDKEELPKTITLVQSIPDSEIRFLATPIPQEDGARWPTRDEVGGAAKMVYEACGDHQLPFSIESVTAEMPQGMSGLEPIAEPVLLKFRSAAREWLFKADIRK